MKVAGAVLIAAVVIACVLSILPRVFGAGAYHVTSGSMEPFIPVDSLVIAQKTDPETLQSGDVIAFYEDGTVITHRVVENDTGNRQITTKGDANNVEDFSPVSYENVIGKVNIHIPYIGAVLEALSTMAGKIAMICLVAGGILLIMAGKRYGRQQEREYHSGE